MLMSTDLADRLGWVADETDDTNQPSYATIDVELWANDAAVTGQLVSYSWGQRGIDVTMMLRLSDVPRALGFIEIDRVVILSGDKSLYSCDPSEHGDQSFTVVLDPSGRYMLRVTAGLQHS